MQFLPIIVAGLIPMALGMVWYHKSVFGQAWMDSIGMTEEKAAQGMGPRMGLATLFSLILAFVLKGIHFASHGGENAAEVMEAAGQMDFQHGAFHGFFI